MRLALPTFLLFLYIVLSLILWLPVKPWLKVSTALLFFVIGLKYIVYERIGGSFMAPDLPPWLLLIMEYFYSAMVILVFLLVVKDFIALLLFVSRWFGSSWGLPFSPGIRAVILVCTALGLSSFGIYQSLRVPKVHNINITLPGLPPELEGFTIAQLTDIHIGPLLKGAWLSKVVKKTNALESDLIVITGDMIDGTPDDLAEEIKPFKDLLAKYGVYGVTGNHEYYFNSSAWEPVFADLGIKMLTNEFRIFSVNGQDLILAGVPDPTALHYGKTGPDRSFLQKSTLDGTVILLQHRPAVIDKNEAVDLQLSGHTHGGHIFFLKWLIASFNGGLVGGLFDFHGSKLYVSPGTGVWSGFSCRIGAPPEISRLVLRSIQGS